MAISLESELREVVRREVAAQLAPLNQAVGRMARNLDALDLLRVVTRRLGSLSSRLGSIAGVRTAAVALPATPTRGRGRPPATAKAAKPEPVASKPAARGRAVTEHGSRACAVIGCKRPSRSKGYCSAHYQKLRLLIRTGRRPNDWVDDAKAQSVREVTLPRGRAGSQALKEVVAKPAAPATPPKPKAWVRKKGAGGMVSLN
ncbi:vegetative protein [Corallococcus sp. H22C18031201]|uniref:vegetative protein n=1 Tax=Citreicoccus inhibens TaxID=2849499 RepID=UPI000E763E6B|nr:vegetative protein [Citreicoccus inhibens]MBU8900759.1 vegetative protein [Citreicoccus inhibens]RJS13876.1 vegetative protein [Corallococcus sp. H22C18031201]